MEIKLIRKGSEQPMTRAGLDDQRSKTGKKGEAREDRGTITDAVMENQSQYHEVVRL